MAVAFEQAEVAHVSRVRALLLTPCGDAQAEPAPQAFIVDHAHLRTSTTTIASSSSARPLGHALGDSSVAVAIARGGTS
jgi:hypothetical protein